MARVGLVGRVAGQAGGVEPMIGVLLPGQNYTHAHPVMHFAAFAVATAGLRVVPIVYASEPNPGDFERFLDAAVRAVADACGDAAQVVLVGKSLGTSVMTRLLDAQEVRAEVIAAAAWLTPLIGDDAVFDAMRRFIKPAVAVIGTRDPHFLPDRLSQLPSATEVVIIEEANHALEVEADLNASIDALRRTSAGVADLTARARTGGR
jgi:pimeloyl-ACP methyl ester carboxylesterase